MKAVTVTKGLLISAAMAGTQVALACGELMVNTGQGLAFQAWLAQEPAEVLVWYQDGSDERAYAGLEQAGHHLTLVTDEIQLAEELARNEYDVVIASFDLVDTVAPLAASSQPTQFLPIVERSMRRSAAVRERFDQFLVEGTGVKRYLSVIDRVLSR